MINSGCLSAAGPQEKKESATPPPCTEPLSVPGTWHPGRGPAVLSWARNEAGHEGDTRRGHILVTTDSPVFSAACRVVR